MAFNKNNVHPPKWIDRFLEWFLPRHLLEDVQGDLHEVFYKQTEQTGYKKARQAYLYTALNYIQPYFFKGRKTSSSHIKPLYTDMIRNYFTIAFRNLLKYKSFSLINLAGLTLGISCAMVIFILISFELSYDTFHSQRDRIFRVISGEPGKVDNTGTPHGLRTVLINEFPEVEKVGIAFRLNPETTQLEVNQELSSEADVYFTTPEFFEMFDYKWIAGNPQTSLAAPGQVVIDEEMAKKYFQGNALGKRIKLNNKFELLVSGIIEKTPSNSDFPVQMAVSHITFEKTDQYEHTYRNAATSSYHAYLLLKEKTDSKALEARFPAMVTKYLGEETAKKYLAHTLQPLSDIHFNENFGRNNFSKRATSKATITSLTVIGIFLILTACFNFINLSTAQAVKRSKEVAIRKVLGSTRRQLIGQFLHETFFLTLISILFSLLLARQGVLYIQKYLLIPVDFSAVVSPSTLLIIIALAILVSLLAGFYPALVLSAFEPVKTLKNSFTSRASGGRTLRKGLVVFQFCIAQVLILCTLVVVSQMHYINSTPLGFDKQAILMVGIPESNPGKLSTLKNSLSGQASIKNISFSLNTPAATTNKWWDDFMHHSAPGEFIETEVKSIDENYLPMYGIGLLAGRNIRESDTTQIIVNQTLLKKIGIVNPQAALGETITYRGRQAAIVGVVKDFHTLSLHKEIRPLVMWRDPSIYQKMSLKLNMQQAKEAIAGIEQHWEKAFPDHYFTYKFLEDDLATFYERERKTSYLLSFFAGIAILIGCLGLYGLVSFMTAQKVKEVGIRKVLGASILSVIYLFIKDFIFLIAGAFLIASPVSHYLMSKWLEDFQYSIDISLWMFVLAAVLALIIAMLTVGYQSLKAATANPIQSLRNE